MQQRSVAAAAGHSAAVPIPPVVSPTHPRLGAKGKSRFDTNVFWCIVAALVSALIALVVVVVLVYKRGSISHIHDAASASSSSARGHAVVPPPEYAPETPQEAAVRHERLDQLMHRLEGTEGQKQPVASPLSLPPSSGGGSVQAGVLISAETSLPIRTLSEAVHNAAWKASCVGALPSKRSDDGQQQQHHGAGGAAADAASLSLPCFMNLELVDSRDAGADDGGSLAAFETRIGDGIKRAHRSIPDDALVPAYLHPRPVRVEVVDVAVGSGAVTKSTILSAAPGGRESLFIDHRDPKKGHDPRGGGKEHATPTFRWISPTHRQVSVAVHNSLFDSGAAAQDAPQTTTTFSFAGAKLVRFFGAGNRGASMEIPKDNRDVRLKNLDINHYSLDSHTSLYGVVPLVYCTMRVPSRSNRKSKRTGADDHPANNNNNNKQGRPSSSSQMDSSDETVTVGILFLCGATMRLRASDTGGEGGAPSLSFTADGGGVRIFFLEGPTPTAVLKQYHQLTGPQAFVPLWALGYHQCRWSYRDQSDVLDTVHQGFLDHKLPADAIWLDIDHTDDKRYLTWDKSKFPNPIRMQRRLFEEGGRRLVTISDPHIKRDPGYFVFAQGEQGGHFVTNGLGSKAPFFGHCWPGQSAWIDFQQEATRRWYATLYRYDVYRGSAPQSGIWNDMNEFSVFSGPDLTLPLTESAHIGGTVYERDVHNTNGFYQTMATWQGLYDRDLQHLLGTQKSPINNGARRPFVLTRSFFAGSHRYASVWTGDNQGKWDHLSTSFDMVLLLAMGGIQHGGADVGGFFDNVGADLFGAWMSAGVAYPFFRSHSHEAVNRREPWLGNANPGRSARALQTRYRLVAHLYTLFARSHIYGEPVLRPLFFAMPGLATSERQSERDAANSAKFFFWGNALLFRPLVAQNEAGLPAPVVDVCGEAPFLFENVAAVPTFVSLCTMEWVVLPVTSTKTAVKGSEGSKLVTGCTLRPDDCDGSCTACETPMWQRSATIIVLNALTPSLTFGWSSGDSGNNKDNKDDKFAAGIQLAHPRSTVDTMAAQSPLEVRVAFTLESDGRDGDILAHGTHFSDDGESDFTEEEPSAKLCLLAWSLRQAGADTLRLCAGMVPEQRRGMSGGAVVGSLPQSQPTACFEELQRVRRFVFSVFVEDGEAGNKNAALGVKTARPQSTHGAGGDVGGAAKEESERGEQIVKARASGADARQQTWVVPWGRDKFERIAAVNTEWCVEMKPV